MSFEAIVDDRRCMTEDRHLMITIAHLKSKLAQGELKTSHSD